MSEDMNGHSNNGRPDPTRNVLDLVEAAVHRLDDLREQQNSHLKEIGDLRADHIKDMRQAEAQRIDAIRTVDVGNVQRATEVAGTQAITLAAQVATSAETLRTQVQAAAQAQTIALAAALEPIQKDIADLRRVQYEQQGQRVAASETRTQNNWTVGQVVTIATSVLALGAVIAIAILK